MNFRVSPEGHRFQKRNPPGSVIGQVVASVVSRLGDCEALVRTAAKECLSKADGEGSLNPNSPDRCFFQVA